MYYFWSLRSLIRTYIFFAHYSFPIIQDQTSGSALSKCINLQSKKQSVTPYNTIIGNELFKRTPSIEITFVNQNQLTYSTH